MTKRLQAGGHSLEYAWHGPGPTEAPTLVFLHEGLGCVALWRDVPAALAAATGCGALVYSRLGYGGSDPVTLPRPLHYMEDEGQIVLPQVLAAAGVRDLVLVGHSDGASIALVYAGSAARAVAAPRLLGLALMAPHVFCEDLSLRSIAAAQRAFTDGDLRRRLQRYHGDNTDGAFWGWCRAWLDPGFRSWDIQRFLPAVPAPLLLIQGEDDEYGTTAQLDAIRAGCPGPVEQVLLPACGHSPHRDQRAATLAAIGDFVRRVRGGG